MPDTAAQPEKLLKWMSTLADATRLRLLYLLERHELGVSDLCDVVQMPQSTVSRHLKLLADEGWVSARRSGTTNLYRMILDEVAPTQREFWLLARSQAEQWPATAQDRLRLKHRLAERRERSQAFFAEAATEWDRTRVEMYGQGFLRDAMLALLPPTWTVADLGCGTGAICSELARFVKHVIGVDNSDAMLAAARQRTEGADNVDLRQGDVESLPIDSGSCDAALMVIVASYLHEPEEGVVEATRVLKPGGRLVAVDLMRHDREDFRRQMGQHHLGFGEAQLAEMMTRAGLADVRCQPIEPESDAKGPALLLAVGEKPAV